MNYERKNNCLTGRTWRIRMNSPCKFYETVYGHKTVSFWNFTFWIYASSEELWKAWNLFSHNIVNEISAASFLACSTGTFLYFWTYWFWIFFLLTILFQKGLFWPIFPPFGIALLRLWDKFTWNQYKQHYLLSSQASLRFGNIEKINLGMNYRNKRIIGL